MSPWIREPRPLVLLFSGGVDSGLLAWELRLRTDVTLSTVGSAGSADLAAARDASRRIGLPWVPGEVSAEEVQSVRDRIACDLADASPVQRSVQTAWAVALARAPPGEVLCGQGPDELFLGYAHYRGLDPESAAHRAASDLADLEEREWPRSRRIAERLGRTVGAPFLDPAFITAARAIPVRDRMGGPVPKELFRRWAMHRGLPEAIAARPKRALQYGSGIDRILARLDRGR
jgi:asparagine synthase (glutamine-hydrolysing)